MAGTLAFTSPIRLSTATRHISQTGANLEIRPESTPCIPPGTATPTSDAMAEVGSPVTEKPEDRDESASGVAQDVSSDHPTQANYQVNFQVDEESNKKKRKKRKSNKSARGPGGLNKKCGTGFEGE